jgi:hypothetical protein
LDYPARPICAPDFFARKGLRALMVLTLGGVTPALRKTGRVGLLVELRPTPA